MSGEHAMLDKEYYTNPFPINFSSDELSGYYYDRGQITYESFKEIIESGDYMRVHELYKAMSEFLMKSLFKKSCYASVHDGYDFYRNSKKKSNISSVLKDLEIDLTHLKGMTKYDMQMLVIPFKDFDDMDYFGYVTRRDCNVEYWVNGKNTGNNMKYLLPK